MMTPVPGMNACSIPGRVFTLDFKKTAMGPEIVADAQWSRNFVISHNLYYVKWHANANPALSPSLVCKKLFPLFA